jgi:hypothetical protein
MLYRTNIITDHRFVLPASSYPANPAGRRKPDGLTMACTFRLATTQHNSRLVWAMGTPGNYARGGTLTLGSDERHLRFIWVDRLDTMTSLEARDLPVHINQRHHLAATVTEDGDRGRLYLDGELIIDTVLGTAALRPDHGKLVLLARDQWGAQRCHGGVQDVGIWDRVLSHSEIELLATGEDSQRHERRRVIWEPMRRADGSEAAPADLATPGWTTEGDPDGQTDYFWGAA